MGSRLRNRRVDLQHANGADHEQFNLFPSGQVQSSEDEPGQGQNDQIGHHVQGGIDVVELGLVEAGALDRLIPVKVQGSALEEEGDGEGAFRGHDPCGDPVQGFPPRMVRRQHPDEEQDDGQLDDAE